MHKGEKKHKAGLGILLAAVAALLMLPDGANAQSSSSIDTYSPLTFYGLGDLSTPGSTMMRSMGGVGVALRSPFLINYINPASYSAISRRSALFSVGVEGGVRYLSSNGMKSSGNIFNIHEIGFEIPLMSKVGFGVVVTPFSSVGYRVETHDTDPVILSELGDVRYKYSGEGGLSQIKAGVGAEIFKGFSVGADAVFLIGTMSRTSVAQINGVISSASSASINDDNKVARVFGNFGFQYNVIASQKHMLTLAGTYRMGTKLGMTTERFIPSTDLYYDTVSNVKTKSAYKIPAQITAGAFYHTDKLSLGADYTFEKWAGLNDVNPVDPMTYRNTNVFKFGGQYTPNRGDVRRFLNRLSYRAGARYGDYYMSMFGKDVTETAITFGVGVPIRMTGMNNVDFGFELGRRNVPGHIKENYFKVSVALSLFGDDYWFMKPRID